MLPLKLTHFNVHPSYDLIILSIINFDQFSKPENDLNRKSLANRFIWILHGMVGPNPCQMNNHKYNSYSMNSTYSKGKYYLHTTENLLKLSITREQLILSNLSKFELLVWNLVSPLKHTWRTTKVIFQSSTKNKTKQNKILTGTKLNCPRRGWNKVFVLWRMWKRSDPEKEWILRDWKRGAVTGTNSAWTQLPSCKLRSEDKSSSKGPNSNNVWDLRNDNLSIKHSLEKFPASQLAWRIGRHNLPYVNRWCKLRISCAQPHIF